MIGVAILCYEGYKDLVMSLNAVVKHTAVPGEEIDFFVFDNSEKTKKIKEFVHKSHPNVTYLTQNKNLGCTASRNIIYHEFVKRHPDAKYLVILDQDIEVQRGWLVDMLEVAEEHEDCGVVAWPQAYRLKPNPLKGVVSEVASMCNLHVIEPLKKAEERWGGPFDERFFFHKFDSLICQRLNQLDYRTRLVTKYSGRRTKPELDRIVHHHPHQGVRRHPQCKKIIARSKRLYAKMQREEGWKPWFPSKGVAEVMDEVRKPRPKPKPKRRVKPKRPTTINQRQFPKAAPQPQRPKLPNAPKAVKVRTPPKNRRTLKQLLADRKKR